ncbi:2-succinyl-5-enolpyruvyl-6-hydroxy-3-cyclohexene-1-carboxylic-acid synthase [Bacteroidota bacterium]
MTDSIYSLTKNLVSICETLGITHIVISPGSRPAPLALEFIRNKKIQHFVINDERSAAYMALGMAIQLKKPVALLCTSGTAALNYAPAVAEAFNQQIPLLVLTADRPSEWIGQGENQTIIQHKLFEPNILASYQLQTSYGSIEVINEAYRIFSEAIHKCNFPVKGPVHINIPIKEPLYQQEKAGFIPLKLVRQEEVELQLSPRRLKELFQQLVTPRKVMVLAGIHQPNPKLRRVLNKLFSLTDIVFIRDITSNLADIDRAVAYPELVISTSDEKTLQKLKPDLLITFGNYVISKKIREFLRAYPPKYHWHIGIDKGFVDTYQALTRVIPVKSNYFFSSLLRAVKVFEKRSFSGFYRLWIKADEKAVQLMQEKISTDLELQFVDRILRKLPKNSIIQLGNSSPVRLANELSLQSNKHAKSIAVFSNRGTSGIDGSLSSCVGSSLISDQLHFILIGDQSLMYDRNALWNSYIGSNLKIILLNNKGGGIFRRMEGPASQKELEEYFVNYVETDFKNMSTQHGLAYFECDEIEKFDLVYKAFVKESASSALLEIKL